MTVDNIVMRVITAQYCRLGRFQDSDFAGDLEDSKVTSGESYVPYVGHSKTLVSHSSTESEIIPLLLICGMQ